MVEKTPQIILKNAAKLTAFGLMKIQIFKHYNNKIQIYNVNIP